MNMEQLPDYITFHPEVKEALECSRAVVALESTIISHGMTYPDNLATAKTVEDIVRTGGAIPATIAIIGGIIHIGLTEEELEEVAQKGDFVKVSRRDIPVIAAGKLNGATTVSATMYCASLAGIRVFVTGGIGGVHRGAQNSFDISADITELSRTSVAVVCAGAKSILDLALTLEQLETYGVPVLGFGTSEFPSFYSRKSGLPVDSSPGSADEVAAIMDAKWRLGLEGGIVIANPIPYAHEIPFAEMEKSIDEALAMAEKKEIKGKALTPFLLATIAKLTSGRSLAANIALVRNNAAAGSAIAAAYQRLQKEKR
jgi:pseudouridine-5'-phosphate glycosidase